MEKIYRKLSELTPDPKNSNTHNSRSLEALRLSLMEFGQPKPILIDKHDVIRCGNGLAEAAKLLGWETIWIESPDFTDMQWKAYAIADNKSAKLSEFDHDILRESMMELDAEIIRATGFLDHEFEAMREQWKRDEEALPEATDDGLGENRNTDEHVTQEVTPADGSAAMDAPVSLETFSLRVTCSTRKARSLLMNKLQMAGHECEEIP